MTSATRTSHRPSSRRRRRMTISLIAAALFATAALTLAAPQVAGAQTGSSSWDVFDNPDLQGPAEYWYAGQAGRGYGSNNYRYTYAIGGDANAVNTAVWNLASRAGTQELQVFVPCEHSVTLRDNNSDQHYKRVELWRSNFGVDAIRARCVSNCKTTTQITGTPAAPTKLQATFFNCAEYERGCVRFTWAQRRACRSRHRGLRLPPPGVAFRLPIHGTIPTGKAVAASILGTSMKVSARHTWRGD